MPPLATNALDEEGIALLAQWIDHYANVAPAPAVGSLDAAAVSENAQLGYTLGEANAEDPDVRESVADQSQLSYAIVAGNDQGLFSIDPATGEIRLNGWIDYERQPQHVLTIEVSDNFAPNPGVLTRTLLVNLIDETAPDNSEDLDGNGIFDSWESAFGLGVADPGSNDDGDALAVFLEFLAGGSPVAIDPPWLLDLALRFPPETMPGTMVDLGWNVRNGFVLGADYEVQGSDTLDGWSTLQEDVDYAVVSVTPVVDGVSRVTIRLNASAPRLFMRLGKPEQ